MKYLNFLIALFLIIGCGYQSPNYDIAEMARESVDKKAASFSEPEDESSFDVHTESIDQLAFQNQPNQPETSKPTENKERRIIKTATIHMEIADFETDDQHIRDLIKMMGGYISSENLTDDNYQKRNSIVVRIEPLKLDNFLHQLQGIAKRTRHQEINSNDVTKSYVDLEVRIQSKTEVINRYRELLKKANSVDEILKVESELRVVVEELESVKGQLNYLKNQVGLSTVNIDYYESIERGSDDRPGFFSDLVDAIGDGWMGLKFFVVGLVTIWPFLIIIGVFLYLFRRYLKNRKRN